MTGLKTVLGVVLVLLCTMWSHKAVAVCPVSSCYPYDPDIQILWLNSSTSAIRVRGPEMTIFSVDPSGQAFESAWARFQVFEVAEMRGSCDRTPLDYDTALEEGLIVRSMNLTRACCSAEYQIGTLPGGVKRDMAVVNVVHPEWTDFSMTAVVSLSNETVVIHKPKTQRILEAYDLKYEPGKPKTDISITNWPWMTDEQPSSGYGDTFLQFFFLSEVLLDQIGNISAIDLGQTLQLLAKSDLVELRIDFLQFMSIDGEDIYSPTNNFGSLDFSPIMSFGPFPSILTLCNESSEAIVPRYHNVTWDPTLSAAFTPPLSNPADGPSSDKESSGSNSRTTAIAVGVAVPCVVIIIVVIIILVIKVPAFNRLIHPFSNRDTVREDKGPVSKPPVAASRWSTGSKPSQV